LTRETTKRNYNTAGSGYRAYIYVSANNGETTKRNYNSLFVTKAREISGEC
jgi:hypothetical protein